MFAHWCLEKELKTLHWHAHFLFEYGFRKLDDTSQLHYDIDNILDWGIGSRKRKMAHNTARIAELQRTAEAANSPKKPKIG